MSGLTHFDAAGQAHMVDVSAKGETERRAVAEAVVHVQPETLALIRDGSAAKGDVLGVARLAGIMAAKKTGELIPLCHPLPISAVTIDLVPTEVPPQVTVTAEVRTVGRTGVEMEAMTAVSVAALTIYDMVKAVDRGILIDGVRLIHKSGGKSGTWNAPSPGTTGPDAADDTA